MTTEVLNNYILHYLKKDKTQTAIMLTGEWGSGKTYYVKNELVPFLQENNVTAVVVSLYGLSDISMISKSIYFELRMGKLAEKQSETMVTGKILAKNVLKNLTGMVGINLELTDEDLKKIYESVDLKDKLLIFEDVERSNIDITNFWGYVNELVERDGVKVLLVANENEILKKKEIKTNFDISDLPNRNKDTIETIGIPEDVKLYRRIKEKTISDTLQFRGNINQAIKQIIREFNNAKLNMLFEQNDELYNNVRCKVITHCRNNLRTFIYAIQKTIDIMDKMDADEYEDEFLECLMLGIIDLSSEIKADKFPEWEGNEYLSTKLGSNETPLTRFAYDYIRWQDLDISLVNNAYEAYKEFRLFEKNAEYKDPDMKILDNYFEKTEEQVLSALKNIETRLSVQNNIAIYAYRKLAYYLIYVGSVVDFNYKRSCELMIKNVKEIVRKANINADIFYSFPYSIEDEKLKQEYESFLKILRESISFESKQQLFSYDPQDIEDLYNSICKNAHGYIQGHRFLSKFDLDKIVEMLLKSTSKQLQDFRGILFAVYRDTGIKEFDEKDIDAMKQLLEKVGKKCDGENSWDKIQMLQIGWLKSNLNDFILQLS